MYLVEIETSPGEWEFLYSEEEDPVFFRALEEAEWNALCHRANGRDAHVCLASNVPYMM